MSNKESRDMETSMSVGLAHQLEMAFHRNGWETYEINRLTQGDILAEVLDSLYNRFASPSDDMSGELMVPDGSISIPALPALSRHNFRFTIPDRDEKRFEELFGKKAEGATEAATIKRWELRQYAHPSEIVDKLGGRDISAISVGQFCYLLKHSFNEEWKEGHRVRLAFFIRDLVGVTRPVHAYRDRDDGKKRWKVYSSNMSLGTRLGPLMDDGKTYIFSN
jgi:hypothetical protein